MKHELLYLSFRLSRGHFQPRTHATRFGNTLCILTQLSGWCLITNDLRKKNVPCWFAPHDLQPGMPILRGLEEAIHLQDKFLLILSEHAVKSRWIEREVDAALHQEIERGKDVLFPIRLDNAVLESNAGWARRLRHRHIGDFTNWMDPRIYQQMFARLLQDLKKANGKGPHTP